MWYLPRIPAPAAEPVDLAEAKIQCNIVADDPSFDDALEALLVVAREHVERRTGLLLAERADALALKCDGWRDFERLPVAPLLEDATLAVTYLDTAGGAQTLSSALYELRAHEFEAAIVPAPGATWPVILPGSRITLACAPGYADGELPAPVKQAILLLVSDMHENREPVAVPNMTTVDHLLVNYRRNA